MAPTRLRSARGVGIRTTCGPGTTPTTMPAHGPTCSARWLACVEVCRESDITVGVRAGGQQRRSHTARKARQLLDEVQSPRLKVVFDGANIYHRGELVETARDAYRSWSTAARQRHRPRPRQGTSSRTATPATPRPAPDGSTSAHYLGELKRSGLPRPDPAPRPRREPGRGQHSVPPRPSWPRPSWLKLNADQPGHQPVGTRPGAAGDVACRRRSSAASTR